MKVEKPQPLLFLPLVVDTKLIRALLDSGASDSFISDEVVKTLTLQTHMLQQNLTVRVANGDGLDFTRLWRFMRG